MRRLFRLQKQAGRTMLDKDTWEMHRLGLIKHSMESAIKPGDQGSPLGLLYRRLIIGRAVAHRWHGLQIMKNGAQIILGHV